MKLKDRIPLNTSTFSDNDGNAVADKRSVQDEITRLRSAGMHDAANRLENSCDDAPDNLVTVDPTTSKAFKPAK